jgi:hypothetical protein
MAAAHRLRHLLAGSPTGRHGDGSGAGTPQALCRDGAGAVGRASGPGTAAGLGERLYHETEGLPFFLVEYLTMIARGADTGGDGTWPMPGGVRDLLHTRLEAVSETGRQLLTTAAVIGRSFDFDTLRAASGRSDEETVSGLEALIAQRLIEEVRSGGEPLRRRSGCFHEKLRALVYETSLARRRLCSPRGGGAGEPDGGGEYKGGTPVNLPLPGSQIAYHCNWRTGSDAAGTSWPASTRGACAARRGPFSIGAGPGLWTPPGCTGDG